MRLGLEIGWAQQSGTSQTPDAILDAATRVLDMRDTTSRVDLFSSIAPLTPVWENGDGVALTLDRSQGVYGSESLGAELIPNGGFDTDSDWTDASTGSGSATISGGTATLVGVDSSNRGIMHESFATTSGKTYSIEYEVSEDIFGNSYPRLGTSPNGEQIKTFPNQTTGTYRHVFVAQSATTYFTMNVTSGTFSFDNISVKEITRTINGAGADIVTNGTFDTDLSGWTTNAPGDSTVTWNASGYVDLYHDASNANIYQTVTTAANQFNLLTLSAIGGDLEVFVGDTIGLSNLLSVQVVPSGETRSYIFKATSAASTVWIRRTTSGTASLDNVSVKPLPGNHIYQTDSALQKTWTAGAGGTYDGVDDRDLIDLPAAGRTSDMTLFMVVDIPASDDNGMLLGPRGAGAAGFVPIYDDGSGNTGLTNSAGTPTVHVNNGSAVGTRDDLHTETCVGVPTQVEVRGCDLTAAVWATAQISGYRSDDSNTAFVVEGGILHTFLVDGSDAATIDPIRQAIADKFGITLS